MGFLSRLLPLGRGTKGAAPAAPRPPIHDYQADYIRRVARVDRLAAREMMKHSNKFPLGPDRVILTDSNKEAATIRNKLRGRGYHVTGDPQHARQKQ